MDSYSNTTFLKISIFDELTLNLVISGYIDIYIYIWKMADRVITIPVFLPPFFHKIPELFVKKNLKKKLDAILR